VVVVRQREAPSGPPNEDHVVRLQGATWADYQRILELRGDRSAPRITYDGGVLEIMSPSRNHEDLKSLIGRLIEVWCLERGVRFTTLGSWTLEDKDADKGAEPDECYLFGDRSDDVKRPHLAVEVVWTSGGLNKLRVYQALEVGEVWFWKDGRLTVHLLGDDGYAESPESRTLPGIDVGELASFLDRPTTYDAITAYRAALRARQA